MARSTTTLTTWWQMPNCPGEAPKLCPHCNAIAHKHNTSTTGGQRYRCSSCRKTFSDSTGKPAGHPGNPNSPGALRVARHRAKRKNPEQ